VSSELGGHRFVAACIECALDRSSGATRKGRASAGGIQRFGYGYGYGYVYGEDGYVYR
jgi:hypothetical protein